MKKDPSHLIFAVLATDVALFTVADKKLLVRVMHVDRPPHFPGIPGLPGGLIMANETAEEAAKRIITEKGQIPSSKTYIEQLYTFSEIDRDPRGRVVSVAYLALVPWEHLSPTEQKNTKEAGWMPVAKKTKLAYDHNNVLSVALKRLQSRIAYTTLSSKLVPKEFTLTHLEQICETILGKEIDKRNFRKKLLKLKILKKSDQQVVGLRHRPPSLYTFISPKITEIEVL